MRLDIPVRSTLAVTLLGIETNFLPIRNAPFKSSTLAVTLLGIETTKITLPDSPTGRVPLWL